ncbi:MAG: porin [Pseudomonadota bacterium]|nr:porin [Pseudomonadota bacterium]
MKKTAIALGVAAALGASAAYAESTLYGRVDVSIVYEDRSIDDVDISGDTDLDELSDELEDFFDSFDDDLDIQNTDTFLGVRGSEDLGNGLSAIYRLEFGTDAASTNGLNASNDKFVGLQGGFGTIRLGTLTSVYDSAVGAAGGFNKIGSSENIIFGRSGEHIRYDSPSWAGFGFGVATVLDGEDDNNDPDDGSQDDNTVFDNVTAGIFYSYGPFKASAGYIYDEDRVNLSGLVDNVHQWGGGLSYTWQGLKVDLSYENGDWLVEGGERYAVRVGYSWGNSYIGARYGTRDADFAQNEFDNQIGVAFRHNLSKRTQFYAEYGFDEFGGTQSFSTIVTDPVTGEIVRDPITLQPVTVTQTELTETELNRFVVGLRHDF